ncbi:MAG: hypothetical protein M3N34_01120 [Pseudomonadota bacterium]|nr:hypothetical protein [Pseudomonadota bacterium]
MVAADGRNFGPLQQGAGCCCAYTIGLAYLPDNDVAMHTINVAQLGEAIFFHEHRHSAKNTAKSQEAYKYQWRSLHNEKTLYFCSMLIGKAGLS